MARSQGGVLAKVPVDLLSAFLSMGIKIFHRHAVTEGSVSQYAILDEDAPHVELNVLAFDEFMRPVHPTEVVLVLHDGAELRVPINKRRLVRLN